MKLNERNIKAINDTYKNAHIALQSIDNLLPQVQDLSLKKLLQNQYDGYNDYINDISSFMQSKKIQPQDINIMKKAMLWGSIKMKSLINSSKNQIAEMMIKGSVTGINELTAMKNEKQTLNEEVFSYIDKLLTLEDKYTNDLRKFL